MTARTTSYVKQFDALRFFAAFLTVVYHILLELGYELPAYYGLREYVARIGPHCVTFFFVLSGFLITWLLLKEKDKTAMCTLAISMPGECSGSGRCIT